MSQTAKGHSLGDNCHAPPGDSVASTGSSEAGSSCRPAAGTISTSSVRKFYGLKYYKELNGDRDGGSQSLTTWTWVNCAVSQRMKKMESEISSKQNRSPI